MRSNRNSKPSVDGAPVVVTANTLKDAYKIVRDEYGEDTVILGTRTVNRRHELGLGHERQIEVTVQLPGATPTVQPSLGRRRTTGALDRIMATSAAPERPPATSSASAMKASVDWDVSVLSAIQVLRSEKNCSSPIVARSACRIVAPPL